MQTKLHNLGSKKINNLKKVLLNTKHKDDKVYHRVYRRFENRFEQIAYCQL